MSLITYSTPCCRHRCPTQGAGEVTVANTYPAQVQEAFDVYSVTVVQGPPGASATLTLHDQPCAASGVALDALCLPIVILVGMGPMGQGAWSTTESLTGAVRSYSTPSRIPTHLPVPVPHPRAPPQHRRHPHNILAGAVPCRPASQRHRNPDQYR